MRLVSCGFVFGREMVEKNQGQLLCDRLFKKNEYTDPLYKL